MDGEPVMVPRCFCVEPIKLFNGTCHACGGAVVGWKTCYDCKGRGFHESALCDLKLHCLTCKGTGEVLE